MSRLVSRNSVGITVWLVSQVLGAATYAQDSLTADIYLTAKGTDQRLAHLPATTFAPAPQPKEGVAVVFVNPNQRFQTIEGFGGALTDAAAETWLKLPKAKQQEIISAYFDPKQGLGYSLCRTHIHSCDFSSGSYTYVADGDVELKTFSIEADYKARIPLIKAALTASGDQLKFFVSPWSPPAWMKSNGNMLKGGSLKPEYRAAWASYMVKFIQSYEKIGIPIWGMTVQNEPMATQTWESCVYTAEEERDFVRDHLGPTLVKSGLSRVKLMVWDHNRDLLFQRAQVIYDDPEAAKYVWGAAYHWYVNDVFDNVRQTHEAYPDKHLLFSEGCLYPYDTKKVSDWEHGEKYGLSLIKDLNNWCTAWTDWNILLDETGGPNHVNNFCFAPVHGDTKTGELRYMNSFYYIGHFSRFIRPGARRVACAVTNDALQATAAVNPDGSLVVVVMNSSNSDQKLSCWLNGAMAPVPCPPHSIVTLVR